MIKLSAILFCRFAAPADSGWVLGGLFRHIPLSELRNGLTVPFVYTLLTDVSPSENSIMNVQLIDPERDDEPIFSEAGLLLPKAGRTFVEFCVRLQGLNDLQPGRHEAQFSVDDILIDVASMDVVRG